MGDFNTTEMLRQMAAIDEQLSKSQLIKPPLDNSERDSWAGSKWSEESDDTKSVPGGTDYNPPKKGVFKNINDMSVDEIRRHLEMRKSGLPNPLAAESEILKSVPGVDKIICPTCEGTQIDVMTKSTCGQCNGFGYVWMVPNRESAQMIKSIEAKWNVTKGMPQPKGTNAGGGSGDADTTPAKADASKKPESVGPASSPPVSKAQEIQNALAKAKKGIEELFQKEDKKKDKDRDEDDDEDEAMFEEGEDEEKCAKSLSNDVVARSLQLTLTSVGSLANQVEELTKSLQGLSYHQHEQADLLHSIAQSHMDVAKSLMASEESGERKPARGPKSFGPNVNNVRVLQKGFVNDAPGQDITSGGADNSETYESRYDLNTLKKGATKMIIGGKLNRQVGLRLESGTLPDGKILKSLDKFIDAHGVEDE